MGEFCFKIKVLATLKGLRVSAPLSYCRRIEKEGNGAVILFSEPCEGVRSVIKLLLA